MASRSIAGHPLRSLISTNPYSSSSRPPGLAFGQPEDKLRPASISAVNTGLLRYNEGFVFVCRHSLIPDKNGGKSNAGFVMGETDAAVQPDQRLDATGLLCPLPVLKARRALRSVPAGGVLEVLATDPGATKDFQHFCQTTGCTLVAANEAPDGVLRFLLRKPA